MGENNTENDNVITITSNSKITIEQIQDLNQRTTHAIEVDKGKPKIIPSDSYVKGTDPFDMIPQNKPDNNPSKQ